MTIRRIQTNARMSQAVVHNGTVYLAGQVVGREVTDLSVRGQTKIILDQIDKWLAQAGTSKEHLLSATIWLADIATFDEMNEVWEDWLPAQSAPARATVEARLARPECRVEISVTAATA